MVQLIDGIRISKEILVRITEAVRSLQRPPGLAFVLVGDDPASKTYIKMKRKRCADAGIRSFDKVFPETCGQEELLQEIAALNAHPEIDGILVQLPLPRHIHAHAIIEAIDPSKDVDGFTPWNMGKTLLGEEDGFFPCTPLGICIMLNHAEIAVKGKHAVIVGRSNIVGKPLAAMLMQKNMRGNATVTVAHTQTPNLAEICRSADILIAAAGSPHLIRKEMVRTGTVVIDVGIHKVNHGKSLSRIIGDVDFDSVAPLCSAITPVPGGVGPMTIAMLLSNTLLSYQRREQF